MSFALKYIVLKKEDGQEVGFTFSTDITHADFLEGSARRPSDSGSLAGKRTSARSAMPNASAAASLARLDATATVSRSA